MGWASLDVEEKGLRELIEVTATGLPAPVLTSIQPNDAA